MYSKTKVPYLFRQEELAFMFEMLGLHEDALVQYDELDALFTQFILNHAVGGKYIVHRTVLVRTVDEYTVSKETAFTPVHSSFVVVYLCLPCYLIPSSRVRPLVIATIIFLQASRSLAEPHLSISINLCVSLSG